ncbi:hypothetical protein FG386_000841 [Cryptosporidium ryanae]|uniref:uncharacterized protein n=1 Tax=Cryptosporidium ryanae TaxID=515981 RepID=UPI00351A363E|nr:hypothetical protein FG386_000841 [Cryptosporidium ryanae]
MLFYYILVSSIVYLKCLDYVSSSYKGFDSIPRFQLGDQLSSEGFNLHSPTAQSVVDIKGIRSDTSSLNIIPGYIKEFIDEPGTCPASRSCNLGRDEIDELAERVFILQSEIPELSLKTTWRRICTFASLIIDIKKHFLNQCKSAGLTHLLSIPANKQFENSISKLCKNLPQYLTCNMNDDALDYLAEDLMLAITPYVKSNRAEGLSFPNFCYISSRTIRGRSREEALHICGDSILKISNQNVVSASNITPAIAEESCKLSWIIKTECTAFDNINVMTNLAFEFFAIIRSEGIPNIKLIDICNFLVKISSTIRISPYQGSKIIGNSKFLSDCTLYLAPLIEHEKIIINTEKYVNGDIFKFYPRESILEYFHKKAEHICNSVNIVHKKRRKKCFSCIKKKVKEIKPNETILDMFMDLMYAVKAVSRRRLGWVIDLPFPGSEEAKAMLLLGYSLNTVDVNSLRNPQYIRMIALLNLKRFITPKTAYNIWRDAVLTVGIEIMEEFTPSMTPEIISRPVKDVIDMKIYCGSGNEEVDSLALELLSVSHENNLTNLNFLQFCQPAEALVGVRSEDFYSSCLEALKYLPEINTSTMKSTGKYLNLPKSKISKICGETPRWEFTSSGISYASLVVEDRKRKDNFEHGLKSKTILFSDSDIYSYVVKTATRSALERMASTDQICKKLNHYYSEEYYAEGVDVEKIQHTANLLFRKAVSLIDQDKQLSFLLSGNSIKGSKSIKFESFCSLSLALSKVERRYYNVECARNLRLMFRQNVIINGKIKLATIKSRTITKICMSSPYFEKCYNNKNSEIDEISFDLLMGAQKLRFLSVTYRHLCSVVKNIRRAEISGVIQKGQKYSNNISSFFNSDCIYGLRTLSIGARHAEIICSGTRFWVMCGNYIDSAVDALASQIYADVVQNKSLARFMTVSLFELVDFCPVAEALIHEIDHRYFNRECVNALSAMSINKDYGKSICQSSRHWQGTCIGTIEDHSTVIERIDPIAGGLFNSAQDLGFLDILFVDFCAPAKEILSIKEVTEEGLVLEGHETSMFNIDCPNIISKMLQSLSEEYLHELEQVRNRNKLKVISAENHEKAETICQNFFNYFDPNYGASQYEEYETRVEDVKDRVGIHPEKAASGAYFMPEKSYNQRSARGGDRFNWAGLLGNRYFVPLGDNAGGSIPIGINGQKITRVNNVGVSSDNYHEEIEKIKGWTGGE